MTHPKNYSTQIMPLVCFSYSIRKNFEHSPMR